MPKQDGPEDARALVHDLGNLLAIVQLHATLASLSPSTRKEDLNLVVEAADGAVRLLRRLDGSLLEHAQLHDVVRTFAPVLQAALPARTTLSIELDPTADIQVQSRAGVERVLLNLVLNAKAAGASIVRLRTKRERSAVVVQVSDDGEGIAPENLDRIGDGFTTREDGSGLGLHSSLAEMKRLGGQLLIDSRLGQGTTVHLQFPLG